MRFKYKAIDKYGSTRQGIIVAQSEDEVVSYLARLDLTPISISKEKLSIIYQLIAGYFEKISIDDKIYLYQNLGLMIKSGIDLAKGIEVILEETSSTALKNFLMNLKFNLEQGKKMSEVFAAFPNYFSSLEISIIAAGEESGKLETNLLQLTNSLIQSRQTRSKIISSLIYPSILITMSFILILAIFTLVLPKLAKLFQDIPTKLPTFTQIIFAISLFLHDNIIVILTFLVIFMVSFFIVGIKFGLFNLWWRLIQIRVSFIRKMIITKSIADVSFNFAILIDSGLPITKIIELLEGVASFYLHRDGLKQVREKFLPQGKTLTEAFKQTGVFPSNFVALLGVGEKSGNISANLTLISQFYREQFESMIKNLVTIIEPIILIFVGIIIALIALAVILPIYNIITQSIG